MCISCVFLFVSGICLQCFYTNIYFSLNIFAIIVVVRVIFFVSLSFSCFSCTILTNSVYCFVTSSTSMLLEHIGAYFTQRIVVFLYMRILLSFVENCMYTQMSEVHSTKSLLAHLHRYFLFRLLPLFARLHALSRP